MADMGVRPRNTSRYSENTSFTSTYSPGSMNSDNPSMISTVLVAASKAKYGHMRKVAASRLRLSGCRPLLRASRNRISAPVYSG